MAKIVYFYLERCPHCKNADKMFAELIEKKGHITIAELTTLFDISNESARRDLRILESKGLCKRTHGGALKPMPAGFMPPRNRNFDEMPVFENYQQIARQG